MNMSAAIVDELKNAKTLTENAAVAYATSGENILDFNFNLTTLRKSSEEEIKEAFIRVFYDDPKTAVKYLFYVADVRGGMGERKIFRTCMSWLIEAHPEIAMRVLHLIPEYTRWDNVVYLANPVTSAKEEGKFTAESVLLKLIADQLVKDIAGMMDNKPISLLAKWLPSENTSSAKTREKAKFIRSCLGMSSRDYRKTLSALRKYLDVVEVKMSANSWSEIDYEKVPSKANANYKDAFMNHDGDRRKSYLESLVKGEAKINASVLQPHDIVSKYAPNMGWYSPTITYDETLEQLWKNLPSFDTGNSLVVRDGSGSMTVQVNGKTTALSVATGLAIYMAEHAKGEWNNKFITFSRDPKFINMSKCTTLRDKLEVAHNENDCSNTDMYKVMKLVLDAAVNNRLKQEDMPSNIIIVSDMQFDGRAFNNSYYYGAGHNWNKTLFEEISAEYNKYGYKLPRIIFWNLDAYNRTAIPMQDNELGLVLCSGYSVQTLKMVMSNELDPLKVLLEQVNNPRYDAVEEAIKDIC